MKKLSIIVAAYNVESYIEECLKSIVNLGLNIETEVIVINDGSEDGTLDIINSFDQKNIRVISIENSGISAVRNIGILESTGEYIYFVDGDDSISHLDFISFCKKLDQGFDILIAGYNTYINKNTGYKSIIRNFNDTDCGNGLNILNKYFMKEFETSVWRAFYRKENIINNEIFFTKGIVVAEDAEWLIKILIVSKKVYFDNSKKIYNYRLRDGSVMRSQFNNKKFEDMLYVANSIKEFSIKENINSHISQRINYYILILVISALVKKKDKITNENSFLVKKLLLNLKFFNFKLNIIKFFLINFTSFTTILLRVYYRVF